MSQFGSDRREGEAGREWSDAELNELGDMHEATLGQLTLGSGKSVTARVAGSTRAIAFCPPSVTQAVPSGPTITPWGAAPGPNAIRSDLPDLGSSRPSLPADCAVNQTVPSGAG